MFASRRKIRLKSGVALSTPLLVPSFSSKTFQDEDVTEIVDYMSQAITDEILVSAYDIHHSGLRKKKLSSASTIFLDSGGYEASQEVDLSDPGKKNHSPKEWNKSLHEQVLKNWDFSIPTVAVSYDNPSAKTSIGKQIERGKSLFKKFPGASSEILFKTESKKDRYVNIDEIIGNVHKLDEFDVIGLTEKELGESALDRMLNIAKLRCALSGANLEKPIHIFGSLDTVSTPLYFFAGADIFDGLTWLRYAFKDGQTIYKHNYGALQLGIGFEDFKVNGKVWNDNYYYLLRLKDDMGKFLLERNFGVFAYNSSFFEDANLLFQEQLREVRNGR